jgi:hypothetical protein
MQRYDDPRADRLDTSGYWRAEREFPVPGTEHRVLYLAGGGALSATATDERPTTNDELSGQSPDTVRRSSFVVGPSSHDEYTYRPTVGICGGLWSGGVPFGLPTDQRPDEVHSLVYTTPPLEEDVEILGWARAVLHVSSTAGVMAFVVRLCDVAPDGTSALVASGVLNATRRASLASPRPLPPDTVTDLEIEIDCTGWTFRQGHRIRLAVCSSDFPNLWPTPKPGVNRVHFGPEHPSRLILPVVPPRETSEDFPAWNLEPVTVDPAVYRLSPGEPPWEIAQDLLNDRTILRTHTRGTGRANLTTEITNEAKLEVSASNRDPADVVAMGRHHRRIVRADGVTTVDTLCILRSTETAFHVTIDLDVTCGGMRHFQRGWARTFERKLL